MLAAILLVSLLSSVAAFSSMASTRGNAVSRLSMNTEFSKSIPFLKKPKNLDGLVGNNEFDPFGFAENFDPLWMSKGYHLPSPDGLYDVANPIDAFFHVGVSPMFQIFAFIGALESINHNGKLSMSDYREGLTREPGSFSLPIYGASLLNGKSPAQIIEGSDVLGAFPNEAIWSLY
eukprot:gene11017-12266_t